ncbi:hypothetical protein GCM10009744_61510 [Kribbella alba]|uniref:Secreted protein n=1 Tax=Kribbella alba TaxID=190197 RepID=A0ABP4RT58_9ACTN
MDALLALVIFTVCLMVPLAVLTWLARLAKRHGTAGAALAGAVAAYDEFYRTTAHQSHYELRVQADRRSEQGSPDDH